MPYSTDKENLESAFLKRNVKLLPCQREMVGWWYDRGTGIRALARMFKVDRRLIQFILFPDRQKKNVADRKARGGWKQYYDQEYNNITRKKHRRYKHETLSKWEKRKRG